MHSLGFTYIKIEDIQVCRKRGAMLQAAKWCSAFVTLKTYDHVTTAVFSLDGSYMPKLSSRHLFAERAVPRLSTLMKQGPKYETDSIETIPSGSQTEEKIRPEEVGAAPEVANEPSGVNAVINHFLEVKQEEKDNKRKQQADLLPWERREKAKREWTW